VREVIEGHAGGMRDGVKLKGFLPGGAGTDFLTPAHLDLMADYATIRDAGSRLGTATMIILDDQTDVVGMVLNLTKFFAQESCGFCTPCRDGLPRAEQILRAMVNRQGMPGDIEDVAKISWLLRPGMTFCALAPGAAEPIDSALKYFRADFERWIAASTIPAAQQSEGSVAYGAGAGVRP
jgi:NADH-quinone oxidoreductase subunit F